MAPNLPSLQDTIKAGGTIYAPGSQPQPMNPHDAPGYNPVNDPTSSINTRPQPVSTSAAPSAADSSTIAAPSVSANVPIPTTITSANTAPATPVSLPPTPIDTTAAGVTGRSQAITAQQTLNDQLAQDQANKQNQLDAQRGVVGGLVDQMTGLQTTRSAAEGDINTPGTPLYLKEQARKAANALTSSQVAQNNEIQALDKQFMSPEAKASAVNEINHRYALDQINSQLAYHLANSDYTAAEDTLNTKFQLDLAPIKTQIDFQTSVYSDIKDQLTKSEDRQWNTLIDNTKTNLSNAIQDQKDVADVYKQLQATNPDALKNNPQIGVALANAKNGQEAYQVLANAGISTPANRYTSVPFGGSLLDNTNGSIINSNTIGNNPSTTAVTNISSMLGVPTTTPITQIDTAQLAQAIVKNEGVGSPAIQANNNPGNIKYVGQAGAVQGSPASDGGYFAKFPTLMDGQQALLTQIRSDQAKGGTLGDYIARYTNTTNPDTANLTPASPAATNPSFPSNPNFQSLSPSDQITVASLLNYTADPKALTTRGGYNQTILNKVKTIDPSFDEGKYQRIQTLKTQYQTGTESDQITAANTAIAHMAELKANFDKLGNGDTDFGNLIKNTTKNAISSPAYKDVKRDVSAVSSELAKVYGGATVSGIDDWQKSLNPNMTPDEQASFIKDGLTLLFGKTTTLNDKYKNVTGEDYPIFNQTSQGIFKQFGVGPTGDTPASAPQQGDTKVYNGVTYKVVGGNWVAQ